MTERRKLFELGHVIRTSGALIALVNAKASESAFLCRHQCGDFGEISVVDRDCNEAAIKEGGRVFSAYQILWHTRLWVITDADRRMTTLLLPSEYDKRFPHALAAGGPGQRQTLYYDI